MLLAFCCVQISVAQVPYGIFELNSRTLTIGYADKLPDGAIQFDGNSSLSELSVSCRFAETIVIDPSFAKYKPTSCSQWFSMFSLVTTIKGLENINTEDVTNMEYMFEDCMNLKSLDLSGFDTRNVTNMYKMFNECNNLETIYVGDKWDVSKVDTVYEDYEKTVMFYRCFKLQGGKGTLYENRKKYPKYAVIDGGDNAPGLLTKKSEPRRLSGVEPYAVFNNGTLTLYYNNKHNANSIILTQWSNVAKDVKKVVIDKSFAKYKPKSTTAWFNNFASVTEIVGLNNINTSEVTDMSWMFRNCINLSTLDLSTFDTKNVENVNEMFGGCVNLTTIYVGNKWNLENVKNASLVVEVENLDGSFEEKNIFVSNDAGGMFFACSKLCGGQGSKLTVEDNDKNYESQVLYAKIDGGVSAPGLLSKKGDKILELPRSIMPVPYVTFDGGVMTFSCSNNPPKNACVDYFEIAKMESLYLYSKNPFSENVTKVVFDDSFKDYPIKSCSGWFSDFTHLTEIVNFQYLNAVNVESMDNMFYCCINLKSIDMSNILSYGCGRYCTMDWMFWGCIGLTSLDLSNCNTYGITSTRGMFAGCLGLTSLDLSNFYTSNVEDMTEMFSDCINLTSLNLGKFFYTERCLNMHAMFSGCEKLTSLDLSSFKTSEVYRFKEMFSKCKNLSKIYVSKYWTIDDSVSDDEGRDMFLDCPNLVGGKGTKYDPEKINLKYAKIDGGESAPGYFIEKEAPEIKNE